MPMPRQVVDRVHALATDKPEKLVFYDRHGRAIGDSSTNIELTDNEARIQIEDEQEEVEAAAHLHDCLLDGGINDEEESSLSDIRIRVWSTIRTSHLIEQTKFLILQNRISSLKPMDRTSKANKFR
jgi:predicted metal-dependent HD superfamily phosphohydrolase